MRHPATLSLLAVLAAGCTVPEGGSVDLQVVDVDGDVEDNYAVDWDGGVTWTREVGCSLSETGDELSYEVFAVDRSQGELRLDVVVQAYDGPDDYERDEFQPTAALSIDWTDEETGELWHLGTDAGGRCAITINDPSRSGALACVDVAVFRDQVRTEDLASVSAQWTCAQVARGDLSAKRSLRGPDPSR